MVRLSLTAVVQVPVRVIQWIISFFTSAFRRSKWIRRSEPRTGALYHRIGATPLDDQPSLLARSAFLRILALTCATNVMLFNAFLAVSFFSVLFIVRYHRVFEVSRFVPFLSLFLLRHVVEIYLCSYFGVGALLASS